VYFVKKKKKKKKRKKKKKKKKKKKRKKKKEKKKKKKKKMKNLCLFQCFKDYHIGRMLDRKTVTTPKQRAAFEKLSLYVARHPCFKKTPQAMMNCCF